MGLEILYHFTQPHQMLLALKRQDGFLAVLKEMTNLVLWWPLGKYIPDEQLTPYKSSISQAHVKVLTRWADEDLPYPIFNGTRGFTYEPQASGRGTVRWDYFCV